MEGTLDFDEFLNESLQNPEVKREYDALETEFSLIRTLLDARKAAGMTQKDLAAKTGIRQGDISKFERGRGNPSLKTLERLAEGLGMQCRVVFVPHP